MKQINTGRLCCHKAPHCEIPLYYTYSPPGCSWSKVWTFIHTLYLKILPETFWPAVSSHHFSVHYSNDSVRLFRRQIGVYRSDRRCSAGCCSRSGFCHGKASTLLLIKFPVIFIWSINTSASRIFSSSIVGQCLGLSQIQCCMNKLFII